MIKKTPLSKQDFNPQELQEILEKSECIGYYSIQRAMEEACIKAKESGNNKKEEIYRLFAEACSMYFKSELASDPFGPHFTSPSDGRTLIVDDLQDEQINFLSEILDDIKNPYLKARLADIVCIRLKHQDNAKRAIDAYYSIPLETNNLNEYQKDFCESLNRAITLADMIRDENSITNLKDKIIIIFDSNVESPHYFLLKIADLLFKLPLNLEEGKNIAEKLKTCGEKFKNDNNSHDALYFFEKAFEWYNSLKNADESYKMIKAQADMICERAKFDIAEGRESHANFWYEKAIQKLREIPNRARKNIKVDKYIKKLEGMLSETATSIYSEMGSVSSPVSPEIIKQQINSAIAHVQGKSPIDTLVAFANISNFIDYEKVKADAIDMLKGSILADIPTTHVHRDGRVTKNAEDMDLNQRSIENTPQVHDTIMRSHEIHVKIMAQNIIVPALMTINTEHVFREGDFLLIARESPIVPQYREELFAKGLFAGYNRDYATAMHILAPQLEGLVREHLKCRGYRTTTLHPSGKEDYINLSGLIDKPEIEEIFGKNIAFEIKALFCDPIGANIRNEIAHGLLKQNEFNSSHNLYAWWFIFKLIFNAYILFIQRPKAKKDEG